MNLLRKLHSSHIYIYTSYITDFMEEVTDYFHKTSFSASVLGALVHVLRNTCTHSCPPNAPVVASL